MISQRLKSQNYTVCMKIYIGLQYVFNKFVFHRSYGNYIYEGAVSLNTILSVGHNIIISFQDTIYDAF